MKQWFIDRIKRLDKHLAAWVFHECDLFWIERIKAGEDLGSVLVQIIGSINKRVIVQVQQPNDLLQKIRSSHHRVRADSQ